MNDERFKKYMDEAFKFSFNFYKKETKLINELKSLKKQLSKKDEKLDKAIEALEFYADKSSWLPTAKGDILEIYDYDKVKNDFDILFVNTHRISNKVGGKKARQVLKEIKGKL